MAFCTNCGNPLNADMKFCPNCGTPVASVVPVSNPVNPQSSGIIDPDIPAVSQPVSTPMNRPSMIPSPVFGTCKILLNSIGKCSAQSAALILQNLLDYSETEVQQLLSAVPTLIAKDLTEQQAYYVTQTLQEYGMVNFYVNAGKTVKPDPQAASVFDANCALKDEVFNVIAGICPQQRYTVFTHLG